MGNCAILVEMMGEHDSGSKQDVIVLTDQFLTKLRAAGALIEHAAVFTPQGRKCFDLD